MSRISQVGTSFIKPGESGGGVFGEYRHVYDFESNSSGVANLVVMGFNILGPARGGTVWRLQNVCGQYRNTTQKQNLYKFLAPARLQY